MNQKKAKILRNNIFKNAIDLPERSYKEENEKDKSKLFLKSIHIVKNESGEMVEQKVAPSKGSPFTRQFGLPAIFNYKTHTSVLDNCMRKTYQNDKKEYLNAKRNHNPQRGV
jgi:hypothetical protein